MKRQEPRSPNLEKDHELINSENEPMTSDDKLMIAETIYLYAIGIDTKDFDLYRSILLTTSKLIFLHMKGHLYLNPIS
ncbi:MAG: hypothetical protein CM15mP49_34080 [Actinomycetota bacterium]|nr:MAG: hypothetical protein CM15mP49_34080 [Actinomycetota bacterium]